MSFRRRARTALAVLAAASAFGAAGFPALAADHPAAAPDMLPDAQAAKIVTVAPSEPLAVGGITLTTRAVAVKENAPKEVLDRFGEVYAFSPSFIAVRKGAPVVLRLWNLQKDDAHDFALQDPKGDTLMMVSLPPLKELDYVFTFHKAGLFTFLCTVHQPAMSGQILVLPK